jgi:hypothetical protein
MILSLCEIPGRAENPKIRKKTLVLKLLIRDCIVLKIIPLGHRKTPDYGKEDY